MRSFLPETVPWGRPALPGVPLPPFAGYGEHQVYVNALQLHVALADEGPPSLAAKILNEVVATPGTHAERGRLTAVQLRVSLSTYFPAPWTPETLAAALSVLDRGDAPRHRDGAWRWGYDPDFAAVPRPGGGWAVERHERAGRTRQSLERDGDLVLLWMADFTNRHPYPFVHQVSEEDARALAPAVAALRRAHAVDTGYPYLNHWRAFRDAHTADPGR